MNSNNFSNPFGIQTSGKTSTSNPFINHTHHKNSTQLNGYRQPQISNFSNGHRHPQTLNPSKRHTHPQSSIKSENHTHPQSSNESYNHTHPQSSNEFDNHTHPQSSNEFGNQTQSQTANEFGNQTQSQTANEFGNKIQSQTANEFDSQPQIQNSLNTNNFPQTSNRSSLTNVGNLTQNNQFQIQNLFPSSFFNPLNALFASRVSSDTMDKLGTQIVQHSNSVKLTYVSPYVSWFEFLRNAIEPGAPTYSAPCVPAAVPPFLMAASPGDGTLVVSENTGKSNIFLTNLDFVLTQNFLRILFETLDARRTAAGKNICN